MFSLNPLPVFVPILQLLVPAERSTSSQRCTIVPPRMCPLKCSRAKLDYNLSADGSHRLFVRDVLNNGTESDCTSRSSAHKEQELTEATGATPEVK